MPFKEGCIFCDIAQKKSPANIEGEDDDVIAFWDIAPKTPVHLVVIPKEHYSLTQDVDGRFVEVLGKMLIMARNVAQKKDLDEGGYRLVINSGIHAGQVVEHLHLHLLGGKALGKMG